ncbi:MAG: hypothetical protein H6842_11155 [Rhodospirillaceae bacterium]|nr:hypothetical protein [Rhodospirillaceae bacterium]
MTLGRGPTRLLAWTGLAAALAGGLALWWQWGLPVAMGAGAWFCIGP